MCFLIILHRTFHLLHEALYRFAVTYITCYSDRCSRNYGFSDFINSQVMIFECIIDFVFSAVRN